MLQQGENIHEEPTALAPFIERPIRQRQARGRVVTVLERSSGAKRWLDMARILVVDTQTELRHQLVRLLEQAGHRATAVATISEAATFLKEHVPDLLATNVVLTDGSGTNLAKQA